MKKYLSSLPSLVLTIIVAVTILLVPHLSIRSYIFPTITSKLIFFLYALIPIAISFLIYFAYKKKILISKLDIWLCVLFLFIIINRFLFQTNYSFSIRYLELLGLSFLYLVIRSIPKKHYLFLLIAFIIGGFFQIFLGFLELSGYRLSNHSQFLVTGSFFNPGSYSAFLSIILGIYMCMDIYYTNMKLKKVVINTFLLIYTVCLIILLFYTKSRVSFLIVFASTLFFVEKRFHLFKVINEKTKLNRRKFNGIILGISFLFITSLYYLKKDSSNGRILIWKVTSSIIKDNFLLGTGFDSFRANYMSYQAKYFSKNNDSYEVYIADNVDYAFNEFLQFFTENGFIGLLILGLTIYYMLTAKYDKNNIYLIVTAKIILLSIGIISLFSYPMQILPIKILMVIGLSILAKLAINKHNLELNTLYNSIFKLLIIGVFLLSSKFYFNKIRKMDAAFMSWKTAFSLYYNRNYEKSIITYKAIYPFFKNNGEFLMNYGKALSINNNHNEAIMILNKSKKYLNSTVINIALGDSYKEIRDYQEAEKNYLEASYMIPNRFYPKYLLAILYKEMGNIEKSKHHAKEIINKKPKVKSTATKQMKEQMKDLLLELK